MKRTPLLVSAALGLAIAAVLVLDLSNASSKSLADASNGWFAAGSHPKDYKMEITSAVHHSGSKSAMIQFTAESAPSGFGTYMQMHKPGSWLGKKIKMTGYVKSDNVGSWAGMWCRVDGEKGEMIDFDNMGDRPIKGTTDWTKYEIVVNVQKEAKAIAYGVLLDGKGTVYFDDISFQILGDAVPGERHDKKFENEYPDKPANLDFEN